MAVAGGGGGGIESGFKSVAESADGSHALRRAGGYRKETVNVGRKGGGRAKAGGGALKLLSYKKVCLLGDPTQLGPPLRVTHLGMCVKRLVASALSRSRKPT